MNKVTVGQLPPLDLDTLEDDDMLMIWDASEHKNFVKFAKEEVHKPNVSPSDAPKVTRNIRLGDLRKHLNKRPSLWKRLTNFFRNT